MPLTHDDDTGILLPGGDNATITSNDVARRMNSLQKDMTDEEGEGGEESEDECIVIIVNHVFDIDMTSRFVVEVCAMCCLTRLCDFT